MRKGSLLKENLLSHTSRCDIIKNNKNVTIDYDPTSCDTFIIEEDLFPIRFTNCLIFSGFVLVCCAALFII